MAQVVIENPIRNSPFREPSHHFKFTEEGITNEIVESRRPSSYFIPIARSKKSGKQLSLGDWLGDRVQENPFINEIRGKVSTWRKGGYLGVTRTTRRLLDYWTREGRERRLFFCQLEAVETAIYIAEVAKKYGDVSLENRLRLFNDDANPELFRVAFKMATGSGKTVVMAMLISWQVLNKLADPQDKRFSDTFLLVTPGITIKDRLRVLLPNDPQNYYRELDIVTGDGLSLLGKAKIVITNFHALKQRDKMNAGRLVKSLLRKDGVIGLTETPDEMVRRVCRELGTKRNIVVINDEAHHCYRRKQDGEDVDLTGEDRREAQKREEEARVWISGLEAIKRKIGIKVVYDLSATPFFLRGSGYPEGTLFPWVVSDFSLIDAIESGVVKIPRVPAVVQGADGEKTLKPVFQPFDTLGSTRHVAFDTRRQTYRTREDKCHLNYVVQDSDWESKLANSLEDMDEVVCYVKNQNLGFTVPYAHEGTERAYLPDYIVRVKDGGAVTPLGRRSSSELCEGGGGPDLLNLILEVTGENRKEKVAKVDAARTLWIPAVNNHGGFGRWAFLEITDPWNAKHLIRDFLKKHDTVSAT